MRKGVSEFELGLCSAWARPARPQQTTVAEVRLFRGTCKGAVAHVVHNKVRNCGTDQSECFPSHFGALAPKKQEPRPMMPGKTAPEAVATRLSSLEGLLLKPLLERRRQLGTFLNVAPSHSGMGGGCRALVERSLNLEGFESSTQCNCRSGINSAYSKYINHITSNLTFTSELPAVSADRVLSGCFSRAFAASGATLAVTDVYADLRRRKEITIKKLVKSSETVRDFLVLHKGGRAVQG